jgi:polyisoprenoid-binding protein YceI
MEIAMLTITPQLKKRALGLTFASLLMSAGSAVAADYKIDKEGQHAFLQFRIKHLGYSWIYGSFKDFDGTFTYDEQNPASDKVNVTINTNSLDTNHAERDKHLRSAEFLNTGKYPQATFVSTNVEKDGDELKITGNFTLNGVTKPLTLEAKLIGQGDDPWGAYRAGFEAEGEFALKDYNINTKLGPASQNVQLIISLEGVRPK